MNHNNTNHYNDWRKNSSKVGTRFIHKGSNPLTEHYSAINENIEKENPIYHMNDTMIKLFDEINKNAEKVHYVLDIDTQQDFIMPEPSEFEIDIEFYFNIKEIKHNKIITIKARDRFEAESILKTKYTNLTKIDFIDSDFYDISSIYDIFHIFHHLIKGEPKGADPVTENYPPKDKCLRSYISDDTIENSNGLTEKQIQEIKEIKEDLKRICMKGNIRWPDHCQIESADTVDHETGTPRIDPQTDSFIDEICALPELQIFEIDIEYYLNTKKITHNKKIAIKANNRAEADSILRTQYLNLTKIDFK